MADDLSSTMDAATLDAAVDEIAEASLPPEVEVREPAAGEGGDEGAGPSQSTTSPGDKPSPAPGTVGDGQPAPRAEDPLSRAPDTLTAETKAVWPTLPENVRADIVKREQDFKQGLDQLRPSAELGEGFLKTVGPYLPVMKEYGVSPVGHVQDMLKYHALLMFGTPQQKADILYGLAQDSGLDLRALVQGLPVQVNNEVQQLKQTIARQQAQIQNVSGRFQQEDLTRMEGEVMKFGNDTAAHPYFWEVAPAMVELYRQNPKMTLEQAYNTALAANSTLYGQVLDQRATAKAEKKRLDAIAASNKARRNRGIRLQSSSGVRPAAGRSNASSEEDLDATLREALNDIHSR